MSFKIQKTTAEGLCETCRHGQAIEYDGGEATMICHWAHPIMTIQRPVVRCGEYDIRGRMNKREMEEIAWVVRTDSSGQKIGFKPPIKKKDEDDF